MITQIQNLISAPVAQPRQGEQGERGKSAYQSYLDTTADDPPLSEADWSAGGGGEGGATTYAALTDKTTVDLPTINTPLSQALTGKSATNHLHTGVYDVFGAAAAVSVTLTAHTDSEANPHSVTKTQIGLGSVENTALSTWSGSANIGTVGTITSGTWQGSIIAPAYLGTGTSIGTKFLRGDGTYQTISGGGDALTSGDLSQFAATTSAQLNSVLSDASITGTNTGDQDLSSLQPKPAEGAFVDGDKTKLDGIAAGATGDQDLSGLVSSSTLSTWAGTANITTTGTITTGTWQGTAIADAHISSAATWNAKGAAGQVSTYLIDDGIHTLTSASGVATPDANDGVSQKFPLTENVTDFDVPTNLADGASMLIQVLQDSTPRTLALDAAWKVMGGGVAADIGTLAAGEYAWLSISRYGTDYLISITAQA